MGIGSAKEWRGNAANSLFVRWRDGLRKPGTGPMRWSVALVLAFLAAVTIRFALDDTETCAAVTTGALDHILLRGKL